VAPYQPETIQKLEKIYGEVLEKLENDKLDFDLIDESGLADCSFEYGEIHTGCEKFRVLVLFDSAEPEEETAEWIWSYLENGGSIAVVKTDIETKFIEMIMEKYPTQITECMSETVVRNCLKMGAKPLLDIAEDCPQVRVRRSVTEDAELWFVHNRAAETEVTVRGKGVYTIFSCNGSESTIKSEGEFRLILPEMSAVMLIRQKAQEIPC
jgi:hypothetical protein